MSNTEVRVNATERLNRNLSLLQSGAVVTIDISTPAGQKVKFRTTFIGYLPKKYVLIQIPDSNRLGSSSRFITQGTAVTVRGLIEGHEGTVAAFISTIKQTLQLPSRIMVLEFPQKVSVQNLRSAIRIDTEIPAKVKVEQEHWQALITDISISGCQIIIENGQSLKWTKDGELEATVEDVIENESLMLQCIICSVKNVGGDLSLGVKFNADMKEKISQLINHIVTHEGL